MILLESVSNWVLTAKWVSSIEGLTVLTSVNNKIIKAVINYADIQNLFTVVGNPLFEWVEGAVVDGVFQLYHVRPVTKVSTGTGYEVSVNPPSFARMHPGQTGGVHLLTAWLYNGQLVCKCSGNNFDFSVTPANTTIAKFTENVDSLVPYRGEPPAIVLARNGTTLTVTIESTQPCYLTLTQGTNTTYFEAIVDSTGTKATATLTIDATLPLTVSQQVGILTPVSA